MTDTTQTPADDTSVAPGVSDADKASIEVGQRGLSEPGNPNELKPEGPQRPDHIPEKFWKDGKVDVEAMAKSYGELERARSAPKEEQPAAAGDPPVAANGKIEKPAEAPAEAASPLTGAMEKARAEFAEGQKVSDETVAELEAAGIPKEIFAVYLQGLEALSNQTMSTIHGFVDGKDNYDAMARWAAEKLTDSELDAFNTSLDNPELRETAVRGLYARYSQARPSEGTLVTPSGTPASGGDVYTDRSQLLADQKDPRYGTDPAFRQSVMEKLQRSQRGGFQLVQRSMFEKQVWSN